MLMYRLWYSQVNIESEEANVTMLHNTCLFKIYAQSCIDLLLDFSAFLEVLRYF